jgi:molybdopterin/thiamine biosynthesis adenylyltransferase
MYTLVLTHEQVAELMAAARLPIETGGVLIASIINVGDGNRRLLGRQIIWTPDGAYRKRTRDELLVTSEGYVPALGIAERDGMMAFWLHTHPGESSAPMPSIYDDKVDRDLADLFRLRTNAPFYGALIVSPRGDSIAFSAALFPERGERQRIDRIWQVGDSLRLISAYDAPQCVMPSIYDRNVRAFGAGVQQTLGALHVGVVGVGGTGSAVCEQLARLGVRRFTLVDPDVLSDSNITRVFGSTPQDVGRAKVEVARDNILRIAPDAACETVQSMLTLESTARRLLGCDVVFGCTDDNAGRLVLSRFSTFMLTPVIDVGVLLSSGTDGVLTGINGRVTVLSPGAACLICRNRIDLARAGAELRTPEERKRLADEGYAPALERVEPAVVAFTSAVASAAVMELLERLIGYGPARRPSEVLLRWHERETSTNHAQPREAHYCDHAGGKWGLGVTAPFLEQTWPAI